MDVYLNKMDMDFEIKEKHLVCPVSISRKEFLLTYVAIH